MPDLLAVEAVCGEPLSDFRVNWEKYREFFVFQSPFPTSFQRLCKQSMG